MSAAEPMSWAKARAEVDRIVAEKKLVDSMAADNAAETIERRARIRREVAVTGVALAACALLVVATAAIAALTVGVIW